MKILIITGEYPPQISGVGDHAFELKQSLEKMGEQVFLLTSVKQPDSKEKSESNVYRSISDWGFSSLQKIKEFCLEVKPDVLHIEYHTNCFDCKSAINLLPFYLRISGIQIPIVTTYHEFAAPLKRLLLLPMMFASHLNLLTNNRDLQRLKEMLPDFMLRKLRYIPLGTDIRLEKLEESSLRQKIRNAMSLEENEILISRFGFLHHPAVDALEVALKALGEIQKDFQFRLLFLGKEEKSARNRLELILDSLNLRAKTTFLGELSKDEITKSLLATDIGIAPYDDGVSERRSAFLTLVGHGVPTVTSQRGVIPDCFCPDQNIAVVSDNRNQEEWTDALKKIMGDAEYRKVLQKGIVGIAGRYSWKHVSEAHQSLYKELRGSCDV